MSLASVSTPLPHGSFAPPGLCCPSASLLLRPDPPVSRPLAASSCWTCAASLAAVRPSPLWVDDHSPGATTHTPERVPAAFARSFAGTIGLRPSSKGSARPISPQPDPRGVSLSTLWCSQPLWPQGSLALLSGRTSRPRGRLPELAPSTVARRERQALLRSQTGQLLRQDSHLLGHRRYGLPRRAARSRAWSPSARPGPAPSECPTAVAVHPPSGCTAAAPVPVGTAQP